MVSHARPVIYVRCVGLVGDKYVALIDINVYVFLFFFQFSTWIEFVFVVKSYFNSITFIDLEIFKSNCFSC